MSELGFHVVAVSSMMKEKQYRRSLEPERVVDDLEEVLAPVLFVRQENCRHRDAVVDHRDEHVHCGEVRQPRLFRQEKSHFEEDLDSK